MTKKTVDDYLDVDNRIKQVDTSIYDKVTADYKSPSDLDTSIPKIDREYTIPQKSIDENMDNIIKYAHEVVDLHKTIDEVFLKFDDKGLYTVEDFLKNEDVKSQYDLSDVAFLDAETRNERFTQACQYLNDRIHDNQQRYNPKEDKQFNSYLDLAASKIVLEESGSALELEFQFKPDYDPINPPPEMMKMEVAKTPLNYQAPKKELDIPDLIF